MLITINLHAKDSEFLSDCAYFTRQFFDDENYTPPAPRLVCVEPNPGPKKQNKRQKVQPKKMKKVPKVQRPNQEGNSKGVLSNIGSAIGGVFGGAPGSALGGAAGKLISHITGWGDYSVESNSLMSGTVPSFSKNGDGVVMCHKEYLTDIVGSTGFAIQSYNINPGLVSTFPYLSQIALNFETYRLNGLIFEYRPTSGSAISTSSAALGTVIMATNYDPADNLFLNKQQMDSYEFSTSCVPFESMIHPVECKPFSNVLDVQYIRTGGVPAGEDIQFYDRGLFQIATQGMQSAYTAGELWVSYDVQLLKPRILPNLVNTPYFHLAEGPNASATAAAPFGTTGSVYVSGNIGVNLISTNTFQLNNAGTYLITAVWRGSNIAAAPTLTPGSNITAPLRGFNDVFSGGGNAFNSAFNAGGTEAMWDGIFVVGLSIPFNTNNATNQIVVSGLTSMTAGEADVYITQLPNVPTGQTFI
jgi:hypothetical protein